MEKIMTSQVIWFKRKMAFLQVEGEANLARRRPAQGSS